MKNGVVKISQPVNEIGDFNSFTIMGDPGCDGLGAEIMTTFAKALTATSSDFAVILGDIVAVNREILYQRIAEFIDTIAPFPAYVLCGNHDTSYYEKYFGLRNYLLVNDKLLIVVLDNSRRKFEDATLSFLRKSLQDYTRDNILLLFHIPPPTSMSPNTVSWKEWQKIAAVYRPFRQNIKYFLSGHIHTFFEDEIDGIPLIVSAGAGARLEKINRPVDEKKTFHHILRFFFDSSGELKYEHISLEARFYHKELSDPALKDRLKRAFDDKCRNYVKYRVFAQDALEKGFSGTAKLLRAAADSEFYHVRNHFYNLNYLDTVLNNLKDCSKNEEQQINVLYPDYLSFTEHKKHGLAKYTFFETLEAEKAHYALFKDAETSIEKDKDIDTKQYYTCSSCGFSFKGDALDNCPICGAPIDKIIEVK